MGHHCDLDRHMLAAARAAGHLPGPLRVAPELLAEEPRVASALAAAIGEKARANGAESLSPGDVDALFLFVHLKAADEAWAWRGGRASAFGVEGLFKGALCLSAPPRLVARQSASRLPVDMRLALESLPSSWDGHPLLTLLSALKWTRRLALSFALDAVDALEKK